MTGFEKKQKDVQYRNARFATVQDKGCMKIEKQAGEFEMKLDYIKQVINIVKTNSDRNLCISILNNALDNFRVTDNQLNLLSSLMVKSL